MSPIRKITLKDEINYQDGIAISKKIFNNKRGDIILYAFDEEESLIDYSSPYENIICIIEGKFDVKAGTDQYLIKSGEMIFIPPFLLHSLKAVVKSKMLLIINR